MDGAASGTERAIQQPSSGKAIYDLAVRLYPLCRSLAGDGVRETLAIIGEHLPLTVHQVPTGTSLYDWKAPQEWIIREAYIADMNGNRMVDFAQHNLHVVNFSVPVRARNAAQRAEGAYSHAARSAGPHSLPHLLSCGRLGLLHGAS